MIKNYFKYFKTLIANKKGQGMVEYGLIIALVAVIAIAGLILLGPQLQTIFTNISNTLQSHNGG
jgi:pilus assembly protein Flp/PilA